MSYSYVIREARRDEIIQLIDFLEEHFDNEEVVGQGFAKKHGNKTTPASKTSKERFMSSFTNLVVIENEKIVGSVMLFPAEYDITKNYPVIRHKELDDALMKVYVDSGVYNRYNPAKMLKIHKLGIHREHRGKGLAKKLIKTGVDWAVENGYDVAFGLFTTPASERAAASVGFVKYIDVDLTELRDSQGERLLADCSPNNVIPMMTMKVG